MPSGVYVRKTGYKLPEKWRLNLRGKRPKASGENNHQWKGGLPKCEVCKKELKNRHAKHCNKHKSKVGAEHHNWISDRCKLKKEGDRRSSAYKAWRKSVQLRDKFKCRIADNNCGGKIEVHHILSYRDFPELHYEINNGITLCHAHHPRQRAEEKRLIPTFQELVSVSK